MQKRLRKELVSSMEEEKVYARWVYCIINILCFGTINGMYFLAQLIKDSESNDFPLFICINVFSIGIMVLSCKKRNKIRVFPPMSIHLLLMTGFIYYLINYYFNDVKYFITYLFVVILCMKCLENINVVILFSVVQVVLVSIMHNFDLNSNEFALFLGLFILGLIFNIGSAMRNNFAYQKIVFASSFDSLTQILNRYGIFTRLKKIAEEAELATLIHIDINKFVQINNRYGKSYGDEVLKNLAKSIALHSRPTDIFGRITNDEFIIIKKGKYEDDEVKTLVCAIIDSLNHEASIKHRVSCSAGYVVDKIAAANFEANITKTAFTLSALKSTRSNGVKVEPYCEERHNAYIKEYDLYFYIKTAIENDALYYNYQPVVNRDGEVVGFETLARLKDHEGKPISPGVFIPIAEKYGIISEIDKKAAYKSIEVLKELEVFEFFATMNFSRESINEATAYYFIDLVDMFDVDPQKVIVEITETSFIDDIDKIMKFTKILKEHNIQIAIDDFGSGASSLNLLLSDNSDIVKVSRRLVNDTEIAKEIFTHLFEICYIAGKKLIIEEIETLEEFEEHQIFNPYGLQGYYFGRPTNYDEFVQRIL